jgi:hypothetical protein
VSFLSQPITYAHALGWFIGWLIFKVIEKIIDKVRGGRA